MTIELYQRMRATVPEHISITMLGVDLDSILIDRANTKVFSHLSTHSPPKLLLLYTIELLYVIHNLPNTKAITMTHHNRHQQCSQQSQVRIVVHF